MVKHQCSSRKSDTPSRVFLPGMKQSRPVSPFVVAFNLLTAMIRSHLTAGKDADLVVINGNPAKKINDIEKVQTVFKDGVGYDSAKLIESARGAVGLH